MVALDRCLLNTGKFTFTSFIWDLKNWLLNTSDCLIQVAFKIGLTIYVQGTLITMTSFVPKDNAIKMNLLLYRILNE